MFPRSVGPMFKPLLALRAPLSHATPESSFAAPGCQWPQVFLLDVAELPVHGLSRPACQQGERTDPACMTPGQQV